jgi:hypothetical protein
MTLVDYPTAHIPNDSPQGRNRFPTSMIIIIIAPMRPTKPTTITTTTQEQTATKSMSIRKPLETRTTLLMNARGPAASGWHANGTHLATRQALLHHRFVTKYGLARKGVSSECGR